LIPWGGNSADFACIIALLFDRKYIKARDLTEALRIAANHFSGVENNIPSLMQMKRDRELNSHDWDLEKNNTPDATPPKKKKKNQPAN
jgi:hypothetical protein